VVGPTPALRTASRTRTQTSKGPAVSKETNSQLPLLFETLRHREQGPVREPFLKCEREDQTSSSRGRFGARQRARRGCTEAAHRIACEPWRSKHGRGEPQGGETQESQDSRRRLIPGARTPTDSGTSPEARPASSTLEAPATDSMSTTVRHGQSQEGPRAPRGVPLLLSGQALKGEDPVSAPD